MLIVNRCKQWYTNKSGIGAVILRINDTQLEMDTNSPIVVYRIPTGKINNRLANNTGYTMSNCIVLVA